MSNETIVTILSVLLTIATVIGYIVIYLKNSKNEKLVDFLKQNQISAHILEFFTWVSEAQIAQYINEAKNFMEMNNGQKKMYVRKQILEFCKEHGFPTPSDSLLNVVIETVFHRLKMEDK